MKRNQIYMSVCRLAVFGLALALLAGCGKSSDTGDITAPSLTITSISDGAITTTRTHTLEGTVETGSVVEVLVGNEKLDDSQVTVDDSQTDSTKWSATVSTLLAGSNLITVTASDPTGNQRVLQFYLTYDPLTIESYTTPIADGTAGEIIAGLFDPDPDPLGTGDQIVPQIQIGSASAVPVNVTSGSDIWSYPLSGLADSSSTLVTVTFAHPNTTIGTVTKTVTIAVNSSAPSVTFEEQLPWVTSDGPGMFQVTIPSLRLINGTVDPSVTAVTVTPTPTATPVVDSTTGKWSATLARLVSGKNTVTASATANNVTTVVHNLLRYDVETSPLLRQLTPALGATDVAVGTDSSPTTVTAEFANVMNATTITATTFTLNDGNTSTVTYDAATRIATLTPGAPLTAATTYTATLTTAIQDANGNALAAPLSWSFTTAP